MPGNSAEGVCIFGNICLKDKILHFRKKSIVKAVQNKQIASELGALYILGGSVQEENIRVRINAQLIDSLTEHHIWAEKYDRDLQNIFDLQED